MVFTTPALERWKRWGVGPRQRMNACWQAVCDRDPTFKSVYMCVELVFGGDVVVRFARGPIKTTSSLDGTVYEYQQGFIEEPDIDHVLDLGSNSASARSLTFTLPAFVVRPSEILLRGGMLAGVGEISLQVDGGDYELRYVLLRGDMTGGVAMGADGEGVHVQLSDPRATQSLQVPETAVDLDRWPLTLEAAVGTRYPLIFNGYPYVPCQRVLNDFGATGLKFLACAPGKDLQVNAVYVTAGAFLPTEVDDIDGKGTPCKTLDFSASAGPWIDTDTVYANLYRLATTPAMSVVQIVRKLLEGYTSLGRLGLNPDLFSLADVSMPAYPPSVLINASGEDAVSVQDFVESTLLASFPMIFMTYAGQGLGPVVVDRRPFPDRGNIHGKLVGKQFPLVQRLVWGNETDKESLCNSFELRYGFNALDNTFEKIIRRDASNSAACRLSEQMVGETRPATAIESPYIHDDVLANYVIDWLVAHRTLPAYYVEWSCLPAVLLRYQLGMNVRYMDPDIAAFADCTATITRLCYSRGEPVIGLTVWHPAWNLLLLGSTA
jgi:hypothetical protein